MGTTISSVLIAQSIGTRPEEMCQPPLQKSKLFFLKKQGINMFSNCSKIYKQVSTYSLRPKLWTKYCFMKQNCQLQSGIAQYENAATPVSSKAIHATHQHYQKRYLTLFQLKGLKGYQQLKFECLDFLSKTDFTFLLWPITFETLEIK